MHDLPVDWSAQLQAAYPKRSGPSGWRSTKLMLALRRALFDSTWQEIIDGCKNYATYCDQGGKTGSEYVQAPLRFIQDGSYLETFAFQAAEDPKVAERKHQESERFARAREAGIRIGLEPMQGECAAAFETRIAMHRLGSPGTHAGGSNAASDRAALGASIDANQSRTESLDSNVRRLTERMRMQK